MLDGIEADQDYLRVLFGLQRYFGRQECCHYCRAVQWLRADVPLGHGGVNSPEMLFTSWGHDSRHRTSLVTTDEFVALNGNTPLTQIIGVSVWRLYPDHMHIVHLALVADVATSLLLDFTDDASFFAGNTRDQRLGTIWLVYLEWASAARHLLKLETFSCLLVYIR